MHAYSVDASGNENHGKFIKDSTEINYKVLPVEVDGEPHLCIFAHKDIQRFSELELKLCESLKRVELRGKRGRKVQLIITKETENDMNLLIHLRKDIGVHENNPYIFVIPTSGSFKNIHGPDAMRKHVKKCDL